MVAGSDDSRLVVELTSDHLATPFRAEVPIVDVARQSYQASIDDRGNSLHVNRVHGDSLRIDSDRETMIFSPGETFSFVLRPALSELAPSTTFDLTTTLSNARGNDSLWSDNKKRLPVPVDGSPSVELSIPLPQQEGVYAVHMSVMAPPGFRDRFFPVGTKHEPLAERLFQVVVLKATANAASAAADWETVLEIDPANPRWWQRLPGWTRLQHLPGIAPKPLGSLRAGVIDHPLGRFVELPNTPSGSEPHWQAYTLPLERVGSTHLLEVEYPNDQEQHLGLSILEPNAVGEVLPIGRNSGVYIEGLGRTAESEKHLHRLVFWPRTNSPLLLATNLHPSSPARFGRIRVLRRTGGSLTAEQAAGWQHSPRLVAAYFARPLVPETLGASEGIDLTTRKSIDDWQTHYESAQRLADYLPYAGYNAAIVSTLADGSSIFPSDQLSPVPLHNSSRLAANGGVPEADALELTLRVFDRNGLAFLPALQLASPMPQLEKLRQSLDPHTSGLEWVGADGRTWLETHGTTAGLAPYYNLLDERVQLAILEVVRELVDRYGRHQSLAGVAIQLSGDGYAQLPGSDWGLDDATVTAFQRETGVLLDERGPSRFAARQQSLTGTHAEAWRSWRAARVTRFYQQLAEVVQASNSKRQLVLTTEEMFSRPELKLRVQPNVLAKPRLQELAFDLGINSDALQQLPGIVVAYARFVEPTTPLVDRAIHMEQNDLLAAAERSGAAETGRAAMFFHSAEHASLNSFAAESGYRDYKRLVGYSSADAAASRQDYARTLAEIDPQLVVDGGECLPMGQEESTRGVRRLLQQLPGHKHAAVHRRQPVTIRTYDDDADTICVLINECAWSVEGEIALDVSHATALQPIVGTDGALATAGGATQQFTPGRQTWAVHLEP
ncbi:MAG: family 10 glycosylhydrolase, partial [Planctomycetes bacterium]|nr:family 10 glycosylhydrolase [Planctomycetota bacterium]